MPVRINGVDKESTINTKSTQNHNTWHAAQYANIFEPQRSNNFEFVVYGLANAIKAGYTDSDSNIETISNDIMGTVTDGAQEAIRLSVSSAFIPSLSMSPLEIKRGNSSLKYANVPSFRSGSIKINDYIGLEALESLYAWEAQAYNVKTEKIGLASDYKHTAYVMMYTPDWQLVRTYVLEGVWIHDVKEDDLNHESANVHGCSATIEYDRGYILRDEA